MKVNAAVCPHLGGQTAVCQIRGQIIISAEADFKITYFPTLKVF